MPVYHASILTYHILNLANNGPVARKRIQAAFLLGLRDALVGVNDCSTKSSFRSLRDSLNHADDDSTISSLVGRMDDASRGTGYLAVQGHVMLGHEVLRTLSARIASHNEQASESQIEAIFALHFGVVVVPAEENGSISGSGVDLAADMLDAMPRDRSGLVVISDSYRALLADTGACPPRLFQKMPDLKDRAGRALPVASFFCLDFGVDVTLPPTPKHLRKPTGIAAYLDNFRVRDLEAARAETVQEETWRVELAQLGGAARIRGLPIDQLYITLIADPTSADERHWAREIDAKIGRDANTRDGAWRDILRPSPTRAERRILNEELPGADGLLPKAELTRIPRPPPRPEVLAAAATEGNWPEAETDVPMAQPLSSADGETLHKVLRRERCCVVLGDPGSGKSVLCSWVANELSDCRRMERASSELGPQRAPFLIRARSMIAYIADAREPSLIDYIKAGLRPDVPAAQDGAWEQYVDRLLEAGHTFTILDGLDEVPQEWQGTLKRMIDEFVTVHVMRPGVEGYRPDTGVGNQILITSRVTGYYQTAFTSESWSTFLIRPMPDTQIAQFCGRWCEAAGLPRLAEQLREEMFAPRNRTILSMSRNPLLLSILCQLATLNRTHVELPQGRAELYEQVIVETAERWRADILQEPFGRQPEFISKLGSTDAILALFAPVAEHIHRHSITGEISEGDLLLHLVRAIARLEGRHDIELSLDEAKERRSFFNIRLRQVFGVLSERARGQYSFLHRTFQEYLAGLSLLLPDPDGRECFDAPFRISASEVADRILRDELLSDPQWRQSLLFLLGQLAWARQQRDRGVRRAAPDMLEVIHHIEARQAERENQLSSEEWALFLADLLVEIPPDFSALVGPAQ
jgi:hypothetical protein